MAAFRPYAERLTDEDTMIVHLSDAPVAETRDLGRDRLVDLAVDGTPVRVRFTRMSGGVDLRDVPSCEQVDRLMAETFMDDPRVQEILNDRKTMAAVREGIAAIQRGDRGVPLKEIQAEERLGRAGQRV